MPHMMPMLWMLIFITSFFFLFFLSCLIFFFYIPTIPLKKINSYSSHKWTWMW